jgi:hypothetical protein
MRRTVQIALISVFGALHAVLFLTSVGLWRNWAIYLAPVEGIILGPSAGFFAALLGSSIARAIRFDPLWMFGIFAEPVSVLSAGLLSRGRWKPVLAIFGVMLAAYFIAPVGRQLPLWTILDILAALFLIYPAARLSKSLSSVKAKTLLIMILLVSFVCTTTDSLSRIFLLVPGGLYPLFFSNYGSLELNFVGAAVSSYIEDGLVVLVSALVGVPLVLAASRLQIFQRNNSEKKS